MQSVPEVPRCLRRLRCRLRLPAEQTISASGWHTGCDGRIARIAVNNEPDRSHLRSAPAPQAQRAPEAQAQQAPEAQYAPDATDGGDRHKSSPLVRKIAKEHNVDIGRIQGSGIGGRVTKQDILGFIDQGSGSRDQGSGDAPAIDKPVPVMRGAGDQVVPMSIMRRKIAEHMVLSKRTSAHVYSVFEVNYSRVDQIRKAKKMITSAPARS